MKPSTGQHHPRRAAAKAEPSPITALRDLLATAFAADIAAVSPMVCEILRDGIANEASPERRALIRNALVVLARQSGELALEVAREFRARFDAKVLPAEDPMSKASRLPNDDSALTEDSHLAIDLALDQCASRLREQTSSDVFQLTARVCELLGRETLDDAQNPIMPGVFARALLEALRKLNFVGESQLRVFTAFGPALLHIAPDIYQHANNLLIERGVLSDFNAKYGRPAIRSATARAPQPAAIPTDADSLAEILDRLLSGGHRLAI
ncbi:MAG: DUF1631 family protein [Usitatibacter sp.]